MRWIYIGLIATLTTVRAEAQTPVAASDGGTIIQAAATGISIEPADKAIVTFTLRKAGATNLEARRNVRALAEQLTAECMAFGIPKKNIEVSDLSSRIGFTGGVDFAALQESMGQAAPAMTRPIMATAWVKLTVMDLALLPKLRKRADQDEALVTSGPVFLLSDDRRARNEAIADGVRKARLDADAYAAALGMRVTRVVSAGDQAADSVLPFPSYDKMIEGLSGRSDVADGMVRTTVNVAVKVAVEAR